LAGGFRARKVHTECDYSSKNNAILNRFSSAWVSRYTIRGREDTVALQSPAQEKYRKSYAVPHSKANAFTLNEKRSYSEGKNYLSKKRIHFQQL